MSVVDEVKARLDIVDVVSEYVGLKKAGRNFKATCPFHSEKTPSFTVNPERQAWHCFGACATGGDVFTFVMRREGVGFGEALKVLAERAGVELVERRPGAADRFDLLYSVNQEAASFYQRVLSSPEGGRGSRYLNERGVDGATASTFQLGMSPNTRDGLSRHLSSLGFDLDRALESGLVRRNEDGSTRDFFRGRLMFPIHDRRGRVAAFGGRSLDGSDPKYINTAATPIFDKRSMLYGLHLALAPIRELDTAVVVEGYMDVIATHQYGHSNVVASMGTALTDRQVAQLKSAAHNFVLALDPDNAGQEATLRSLESSWRVFERHQIGSRRRAVGPLYQAEPLSLRIAALPAGRDPDRLIREEPDEWERLIGAATPFVEFLIDAVASRYDLGTPQGRGQAAEALGPLITSMGNAVEQEHYFQMLAERLGVGRQALEASIGRPRTSGHSRSRERRPYADSAQAATVSPLMGDGRDVLEEYILALLLRRPQLRDGAAGVAPEQFHGADNREVFTSWLGGATIDELPSQLDESLHDYLDRLIRADAGPSELAADKEALKQALRRLEQRHLQELQEGLLLAEDAALPPPRQVEEAVVSVNTRLKELFSR